MASKMQSTVSLKLLIDEQKRRVLFAEAEKDAIDFLFTILTLPLATVVKLLKNSSMVGSLAKLYESIENLNPTYMQSSQMKDALLSPKTSHFNPQTPLLRSSFDEHPPKTFNKCSNFYCHYVSSSASAICPICNRYMTTPVKYVAPPSSTLVGYVKENVTFMIMDDLEVKPVSAISSITLLNGYKVKEIGKLKEEVVHLGIDDALELLKASLQSDTVLTDVFMGTKKKIVKRKRIS